MRDKVGGGFCWLPASNETPDCVNVHYESLEVSRFCVSLQQAFSQELKTGCPKYAIGPAQMKNS